MSIKQCCILLVVVKYSLLLSRELFLLQIIKLVNISLPDNCPYELTKKCFSGIDKGGTAGGLLGFQA